MLSVVISNCRRFPTSCGLRHGVHAYRDGGCAILGGMENAHASPEHTAANDEMVQEFSKRIGIPLCKKRLRFDDNISLELDGYSETPLVLCEASACVTKPKG